VTPRFELVFRAPRVVTAAGEVPGCVGVRDGRVAAVEPLTAGLSGERTVALGDGEVLLPGLVDAHVHVNEPGRTEWEGFATATRAAAAGGVTTERLWQGLADGVIDFVASDHSPSTPQLKRLDAGDFGSAWGGIASLQLGLPAVWTAARARGHSLVDVVRWMAERPADAVGLRRKGRIALGCDADLCVLAPDEAFVVEPERLHHRHPVTPYAGRKLAGVVRGTWLRGQEVTGAERHGTLLTRGDA
jgi:dihydroorotase-like cyclic amidohydrolase